MTSKRVAEKPVETVVSSSVYFPRKCAESSPNLFVVVRNLNSLATWCSHLEINGLKVWTHMHISALWEERRKMEKGRRDASFDVSQ